MHAPGTDVDNKIIFLNHGVDGEAVCVVSLLVLTIISTVVPLRIAR